jgi:hypothetical protein
LNELNPDVKGRAEVQSPNTLIENNPKFFDEFDLIIAQDITDVKFRKGYSFIEIFKNPCWYLQNWT